MEGEKEVKRGRERERGSWCHTSPVHSQTLMSRGHSLSTATSANLEMGVARSGVKGPLT